MRAGRAGPIIAVDLAEEKADLARSFGATDFIVSSSTVGKQVRAATGGRGVDHAFECIGSAATIRTAWGATRRGGQCVVVGVGRRDDQVAMTPMEIYYYNRTLASSVYGSSLPARDIPRFAAEVVAGRLDLSGLITHRTGLEGVGNAFERMRAGQGGRTVVTLRRTLVTPRPRGKAAFRLTHAEADEKMGATSDESDRSGARHRHRRHRHQGRFGRASHPALSTASGFGSTHLRAPRQKASPRRSRRLPSTSSTPVGSASTFPGVVEDGVAKTAANVDPSWIGASLKDIIGARLPGDVVFVNDADAAGLAEVRYGVGREATGSIALDVALGIGGLPRGRVVESTARNPPVVTVALHAVANAQAAGGVAAFIDAEHALDPDYAKKLGVDTDSLLVSQPDTGEQALEIADMLIRSGAIDILVIDSVAALVPRAEIEGEMGDSHVGLQARLMSQALRKITGALSNSNTTAIFINQLREKIGVMFGSPETTTGGKALKFYASIRLDVRRIETLKDGTDAVGNRTRWKIVKNKVAPPFKQAEFDILYGQGISKEGSLIDMGVEHGFVRKSGSWYTYEGDQLGQGKENARNFLLENPEVGNEIEKKIKEKLGIGADVTATPAMTKHCPPRSTSESGDRTEAEPTDPAVREEQARAVCLRLLTARARTRAELAAQLAKRGYPDEVGETGVGPADRRGTGR